MLRCGLCGEAMLPRSARDQADHYVCRGHKFDSSRCPLPPLPRAVIDSAFAAVFAEGSLDVEGTRARLAETAGAQAREALAQRERADREAADLRAQADRIDRDYRAGDLAAASYERLGAQVAEELAAAEAERDQLARRAETIASDLAAATSHEDVLRRLSDLQDAIARGVRNAAEVGDIEALRAAVARVVERVEIDPISDVGGIAAGGVTLRTLLRADVFTEGSGKIALDLAHNQSGSGVPL
jgi:hypothetical protein